QASCPVAAGASSSSVATGSWRPSAATTPTPARAAASEPARSPRRLPPSGRPARRPPPPPSRKEIAGGGTLRQGDRVQTTLRPRAVPGPLARPIPPRCCQLQVPALGTDPVQRVGIEVGVTDHVGNDLRRRCLEQSLGQDPLVLVHRRHPPSSQ